MLTVRISVAWTIAAVSLVALGLMLLLGQPFAVTAQEPKRYQYQIIEVLPDTEDMRATLNEFGANGWELVTVATANMTNPRLIFKK
ncbi:MAG: hypothetical protein P0119_16790 [Nitrospira sp.]|nr:hypothetical protein [Nitrospira sp.]